MLDSVPRRPRQILKMLTQWLGFQFVLFGLNCCSYNSNAPASTLKKTAVSFLKNNQGILLLHVPVALTTTKKISPTLLGVNTWHHIQFALRPLKEGLRISETEKNVVE